MWSYSGNIVVSASSVYYLPFSVLLPVLCWKSGLQQFTFLDPYRQDDADVLISLEEVVNRFSLPLRRRVKCSLLGPASLHRSSFSVLGECIHCEALYGVLSLGAKVSILLYVTDTVQETVLRIGNESHKVFRVKRLEWIRLPSVYKSGEHGKATGGGTAQKNESRMDGYGVAEPLRSATEGNEESKNSLVSTEDEEIGPSEATIREYLRVLDRFCVSVSKNNGEESYLYYSPTINLSLNPEEMMAAQLKGWGATSLNSTVAKTGKFSISPSQLQHVDDETELNSRRVFQWNHMLLESFQLPTLEDVLKNAEEEEVSINEKAFAGDDSDTGNEENCDSCRTRSEAWRYLRKYVTQGDLHSSQGDTVGLFVPAFIRGSVLVVDQLVTQPPLLMQLITRLSCRWAGTRYNRRGLEPGPSGACANLSITSFWLSQHLSTDAGAAPSRFAVLNLVRGSIPRRWEQTANLSFKPPLKIMAVVNGAEELASHVRFLKGLLTGVQQIFCVDMTSTSSLEKLLSDAFNMGVERWKEAQLAMWGAPANRPVNGGGGTGSNANFDPLLFMLYMKYDINKKMKTLSRTDIRNDLVAELQRTLCKAHDASEDYTSTEVAQSWADFSKYTRLPKNEMGVEQWEQRLQGLYYRVNCLDCLDRTNLAQAFLAEAILPHMLQYVLHGEPGLVASDDEQLEYLKTNADSLLLPACARALRELFVGQGLVLSMIYAHSEPHFISFLLGGNDSRYFPSLRGGLIALRRWYHQNFFDGFKQDAISLVTRQHNPAQFSLDIESPFSRDLTSMNWLVLYGILVVWLPIVFSACICISSTKVNERQLHSVLVCLWLVYFAFLCRKLSKYSVTFTNQSLLSHNL